MNHAAIEARSARLHANAKDGALRVDGVVYVLTFDRYAGVYSVTEPDGSELVRFNTRKLTDARKWLRDYLEDAS